MALRVTGSSYFYGSTNDRWRSVWYLSGYCRASELEDESTIVGITPLNLIGWSIAGGTVWGVHKMLEHKLISERQTQPSIDMIDRKKRN